MDLMNETNMTNVKIDEAVRLYIKARDLKSRIKAEADKRLVEVDSMMVTIENHILNKLTEAGAESMRTEHGTAYKLTSTYTSVADWDALLRHVQETNHWTLLNRAVNRKEVEAQLNETGEIPPGVNVRREVSVGIRRS
jgi:hypothetical protein